MDPSRPPSYSLRQLRYFVAVAESGTIRAAAARLRVAESAVSMSLTELERALRVQLVLRQRARGVQITSSGQAMLRLAKALLHQAHQLEAEVSGAGVVLSGPLSIGCYPMLGPTVLPRLLSGFAELHPGVVVDFHEDTQDRLYRRLADGELDVAIMYDLELPSTLRRAELDDRLPYVLLAADHPLAASPLDLREIEHEPMVLLDAPPSGNHALKLCADAGVRPAVRYRTGTYETARALVGRGLGWALLVTLPRSSITYEGLPVVATPLRRPQPDPVRVVLVWSDGSGLGRRAREFIRFATSTLDSEPRLL
ncbi:LysR substrate-binding domain-containing protein [Kutzneria sp. NPDC052558]|uniref:LysR substrate-binding domain-containing protein n=1 Tax=Kutzneria sp. NPDC052558 TaxID=3364121 RepID=UPI0037C53F1F